MPPAPPQREDPVPPRLLSDDDFAALHAKLMRLSAEGHPGLALAIVNDVLKDNPDEADRLKELRTAAYRSQVKRLISRGHPARAFELACESLKVAEGDHQLTFLRALAMARGGNVSAAESYLEPLLHDDTVPPKLRIDVWAQRGRLFKDRSYREADPEARLDFARAAAHWYREAGAFAERAGEPTAYPWVNAATMSLMADADAAMLSSATKASQYAAQEAAANPADYWALASWGEAALLLGDVAEATAHYTEAIKQARKAEHWGDVEAMRRQMVAIGEKIQLDKDFIREFVVGSVVAFAGHMIDHPDRERQGLAPRFPHEAKLIEALEQAIHQKLADENVTVGVCSLANGADVIFAEQLLARFKEAELHVVLPFRKDDFYRTSVDFGRPDEEPWRTWRQRFDVVLSKAREVHFATNEPHLGDTGLYEFCHTIVQGLALLRAEQLAVEPRALIVSDRRSPPRRAGTLAFRETWGRRGFPLDEIDLTRLRPGDAPPPPVAAGELTPRSRVELLSREPKAMLFADVKGFSVLRDEVLIRFIVGFLREVRGVLESLAGRPASSNTWGDGLYLVFDRAADCAEAALQLLERCEALDFAEMGLGVGTPLRIGVHFGPVYRGWDPVTARESFFGSQVTHAARIEPVTLPGCIYASEQFAAGLMAEARDRFTCDRIGEEELAKHYGSCTLYRLDRRVVVQKGVEKIVKKDG